MARRNLLHKSCLEEFKTYLRERGIEFRPGRGTYQVLQVKVCDGKKTNGDLHFVFSPVYERDVGGDHYTVQHELIPTVNHFVKQRKAPVLTVTEPVHTPFYENAIPPAADFKFCNKAVLTEEQLTIAFGDKDEELDPVFENGELVNSTSLLDIRERMLEK